jgi:3',5'-cyclic AMP phosphodiesterase CpdA
MRIRHGLGLLVTAWLASVPLGARALECHGRVVLDRNRNGQADAGEPGLPGVRLTDGRQLVHTDAQGRYAFTTEPGRSVQVIKPAQLDPVLRHDGLPDTWMNLDWESAPALRYGGLRNGRRGCRDFAMTHAPLRRTGAMDVLVFGDPQPKTAVDVDYFRRDIVEPLLAARGPARLGLTLGDVVHDDLTLLERVKAQTVRLPMPWLTVPGNHDLDFDAPDDAHSLDSYREVFGGDTFAWEEEVATFIGLDDVIYRPASKDYIGGLREDQFEFLAAYLPTVSRRNLLVIAAHIPFFDPQPGVETFRRADRERLFALLREFPHVLLLTAHGHVQRQYDHGPGDGWHGAAPLHEFNAGAACGAFWSGRKDALGIPDATMADGTPNGYAMLHVDGEGKFRLAWHAARADGDPRLALHAPNVLRRGAYPAFGVYANVWLGDAQTQVEMRIDDGAWQPMQKVARADPALAAENAADDLSPVLRGYDRSPEAALSTHLWRGTLRTDLPVGEHRVEVRARGQWVGDASASTRYRLDDAMP